LVALIPILGDQLLLRLSSLEDADPASAVLLMMEFFYCEQRSRTGLLMDGEKPAGGRWNYDKENRKPAPADDLFTPAPPRFPADAITSEVITLVETRFPELLGSLDAWDLAVTREDALQAQEAFLDEALCSFGDYQDAMVTGQPRLWHAHLSPYLNSGLLDPLELCRAVEERYRRGLVPLNGAEGFIRQIIGWREYMRGIYWLAGEDGCPFNSLYWHFLDRNRDKLGGNIRLRNQYRIWDRCGPAHQGGSACSGGRLPGRSRRGRRALLRPDRAPQGG
jgi:deoxyribodipyrimidine photolyase-related protein